MALKKAQKVNGLANTESARRLCESYGLRLGFWVALLFLSLGANRQGLAQTLDWINVTATTCGAGRTPVYYGGEFGGCYDPVGTAAGGGVGPGNANGGGADGGGGTGGGTGTPVSNTPNAHTNCVTAALEAANAQGDSSPPSDPNSSAAIPIAYANPIDVSNGNSLGTANGGVSGTRGSPAMMIFPNVAKGWATAKTSYVVQSHAGKTVVGLINKWAPPASNPNAVANTLAGFGMTASDAATTQLTQLNAGQADQLIAAFAFQEGYKPTGCP